MTTMKSEVSWFNVITASFSNFIFCVPENKYKYVVDTLNSGSGSINCLKCYSVNSKFDQSQGKTISEVIDLKHLTMSGDNAINVCFSFDQVKLWAEIDESSTEFKEFLSSMDNDGGQEIGQSVQL